MSYKSNFTTHAGLPCVKAGTRCTFLFGGFLFPSLSAVCGSAECLLLLCDLLHAAWPAAAFLCRRGGDRVIHGGDLLQCAVEEVGGGGVAVEEGLDFGRGSVVGC